MYIASPKLLYSVAPWGEPNEIGFSEIAWTAGSAFFPRREGGSSGAEYQGDPALRVLRADLKVGPYDCYGLTPDATRTARLKADYDGDYVGMTSGSSRTLRRRAMRDRRPSIYT